MKNIFLAISGFFFLMLCQNSVKASETGFTVEQYGKTAAIQTLTISPDGKHLAFIKPADGKESDLFIVSNIESGKVIAAVSAKSKYDQKARSISFVTNDHVLLRFSKTTFNPYYNRGFENLDVQFYNIKKKKMGPRMSVRSTVYGVSKDKKYAYMSQDSHLVKVHLDKESIRKYEGGTKHVIDWFLNDKGEVIAREEYDEFRDEYRVLSKISGEWKKIFSEDTNEPSISLAAVNKDQKSLVVQSEVNGYRRVYSMSLETGDLTGPLFTNEDIDVEEIYWDENRTIEGVRFAALLPDYEFLDKNYQANILGVEKYFEGSAIYPVAKTLDASKIIFLVSGKKGADQYVLFDAIKKNISPIADSYPNISTDSIADVNAIKYKAQDGLEINAILTWPVGVESKKNLPMIALPHGGPQSYDKIQFDWMAQFFARKGYLVFQPNFRGSSGSGAEFRDKGNGHWGDTMQSDITDGIKMLINKETVDSSKVCIVGSSYGGYAALAGGAFTPDIYRCVVSINGVADLPHLFREESLAVNNNFYTRYWNEVIAGNDADKAFLSDISPISQVQNFKSPLLLIHSKDDTVVTIQQSERMFSAMRKAGNQAELLKLKDEDHWLSNSITRVQTLKAISKFLDKHNPVTGK